MRTLFDSSRIPQEIVDVLTVSPAMLKAEPELSKRLQQAWQNALDYANSHPEETRAFFAARYGISVEEYTALADDVMLFDRATMQRFANTHGLHQAISRGAQVLGGQALPAAQISQTVAVWFQESPQ